MQQEVPGGPAAKAGIEDGDVLVGLEGQAIQNVPDYRLDVASRTEAYADWACACGSEECRGTMADTEPFKDT